MEVIADLTLAQYAAVRAALAEGFLLADVLAIEGIAADAWADADLAWTEALTSDRALLSRYEVALAAAEDRLGREVSPLGEDLAAWLAFLAAFAAAPEAGELLARYRLSTNDLARLGRRWARRAKADPSLEKRAARLRQRPLGPVPPLMAARPKLVPSGAPRAPRKMEANEAPAPAAPSRDELLLIAHQRAREAARPAATVARWTEPGTAVLESVAIVDLPFRVTPSAAFLDALASAPKAAPGAGSDGGTVVAASPFANAPAAAPSAEEATTHIMASPFASAVFDAEPPMPLERHASLAVELAAGAREDLALARYQITAAVKERADLYWRARLAADPQARAAWNEAFRAYAEWLEAQRR
jgi:hypothetical protein